MRRGSGEKISGTVALQQWRNFKCVIALAYEENRKISCLHGRQRTFFGLLSSAHVEFLLEETLALAVVDRLLFFYTEDARNKVLIHFEIGEHSQLIEALERHY